MVALIASDVWHWAPDVMLMFVGALATIPPGTVDVEPVLGDVDADEERSCGRLFGFLVEPADGGPDPSEPVNECLGLLG
jgi:hypothetical protein